MTATITAAADALRTLGCIVEPAPLGRTITAPDVAVADYVAAQQQVEALSSLFAGYFERYDVLLCPVCPIPAPPHARSAFDVGDVTDPGVFEPEPVVRESA